MPKTRLPYSPEFRRQMVDLVRAGRDPADLAREFEPTAQSYQPRRVAPSRPARGAAERRRVAGWYGGNWSRGNWF